MLCGYYHNKLNVLKLLLLVKYRVLNYTSMLDDVTRNKLYLNIVR